MNMAGGDLVNKLLQEYGDIKPFEPFAVYNREGDCIEFYLSNEPAYGKRLDGWVTVFVSERTEEVVGGAVKGVSTSLLDRFPGLKIFILDKSVKIDILLGAPASQAVDEVQQRTYKALIDKVDEVNMRADLQPA